MMNIPFLLAESYPVRSARLHLRCAPSVSLPASAWEKTADGSRGARLSAWWWCRALSSLSLPGWLGSDHAHTHTHVHSNCRSDSRLVGRSHTGCKKSHTVTVTQSPSLAGPHTLLNSVGVVRSHCR